MDGMDLVDGVDHVDRMDLIVEVGLVEAPDTLPATKSILLCDGLQPLRDDRDRFLRVPLGGSTLILLRKAAARARSRRRQSILALRGPVFALRTLELLHTLQDLAGDPGTPES